MFKKIFCLIACLYFFTGMIYAEGLRLEFGYKHSLQKMGLGKETTLLSYEIDTYYWEEKDLNFFKEEKITDWAYLKALYEVLPQVTLYGIGGIGRTGSQINEPEFTRRVGYRNSDYRWLEEEKGNSVKGRSELGFLVGAGISFVFYKTNDFEFGVEAQYIFQEQSNSNMVLFEESTYGQGYYSQAEWSKKIEIEKVRNEEILISLSITKEVDRFIFSGGPRLTWSRTIYKGKASAYSYYIDYLNPGFSDSTESENDFEFQGRNKNLLAGFARIEYLLTNKTNAFAEIMAGAQNSFAAGLSFNF